MSAGTSHYSLSFIDDGYPIERSPATLFPLGASQTPEPAIIPHLQTPLLFRKQIFSQNWSIRMTVCRAESCQAALYRFLGLWPAYQSSRVEENELCHYIGDCRQFCLFLLNDFGEWTCFDLRDHFWGNKTLATGSHPRGVPIAQRIPFALYLSALQVRTFYQNRDASLDATSS